MDDGRKQAIRHKASKGDPSRASNRSARNSFDQPAIYDRGAGRMSLPTIIPNPGIEEPSIFAPYEDDDEEDDD
jgi:hypothetical protein